MNRLCDRCGRRPAEHRASDLDDDIAGDDGALCAGCVAVAEAELAGAAS